MAITLAVKNRTARQPIKNLPSSVDIDDHSTVEDVKRLLAGQIGSNDAHRYGLFEPEKKKNLRDRQAVISHQKEVMAAKEILVQDFGLQISWRKVYIIEYMGPILIHLLFPTLLRPFLIHHSVPFYRSSVGSTDLRTSLPLSTSQSLARILIIVHFIKRELETVYLHKFSAASMPIRFVPKNCGHYWGLSGLLLAFFIYSPNSLAAWEGSSSVTALNLLGVALYLVGQVSNFSTHVTLSRLRTRGTTERGIPTGYGFDWVTCPNYMFELVVWVGVLCVSRSLATVLFMVVGGVQMAIWGWKKEANYRKEFGDRYRKKRFVLIPGIV